jgi:hypothetical protein
MKEKKTFTSTPLPLNSKKKSKGAPFPPSHNEFVKKKTPGEPLPSHSTMKKTFLETLNVPLSPLLLPPFHISRGKKNINLHPPPPQQ